MSSPTGLQIQNHSNKECSHGIGFPPSNLGVAVEKDIGPSLVRKLNFVGVKEEGMNKVNNEDIDDMDNYTLVDVTE